jgi:hypothetical protein
MRRLALLLPLLLAGCLQYADDGVYACVPTTGKDCTVCDGATGWCQDWSGVKLGAGQLRGIWGTASDSIWAVGSGGTILFWNGKVWSSVGGLTTGALNAVWGRSPTDVWVVGDAASYLHWDGSAWTPGVSTEVWTFRGAALQNLTGVSGSQYYTWLVDDWGGSAYWDTNSVPPKWALYYDHPSKLVLNGIWSDPTGNVYYVGQAGTVLRDDSTYTLGSQVNTLVNPDTAKNDLYAVWGSGPADVWMVGSGGIILNWANDPNLLAPLKMVPAASAKRIRAVWGTGPNDVWTAGDAGEVSRWDGSGGGFKSVPQGYTDNLRGIWVNATDVWAAAESGILYHLKR